MVFIVLLIIAIIFIALINSILKDITDVAEWGLNKAIKNIEKNPNMDKATNSTTSNKEICFGDWDNEIHWTVPQRERIMRAKNSAMTSGIINHTTKTGEFQGTKGTYQTTLNSCTCPDFNTRQLPCKHIYKLAMQLGEMDFDVNCNNYSNTKISSYNDDGSTNIHTININVDNIINRAKNSTTEEKRASTLMLDFEDENKKELNSWERKLENVKSYDNPDKTLKFYKERVQLAKDFKTFCELKGEAGKRWYQEYYSTDINDAELNLYDYEDNYYENELQHYKEAQEKKKLRAEIKSKILTLAAQEDGVLQKDLYELFKPEDKNAVKSVVENLVANDVIIKEKKGKFNLLKIQK